VTSGFRPDVDETCALLRHYLASNGDPLPTFRDNVSLPSSRVNKFKKMGPIGFPEKSVKDYHSALRNALEQRSSQM
jgi:hypothetical protein